MNTYPMRIKLVFLFFFFAKKILGERCYTPDKQTGSCVPLNECPKIFETFANPLKGSEAHLRRFLCKDDQQLKVCCDTAANFTLLENYSTSDAPEISRNIIDRDAFPECYLESPSDVDLPIIIAESLDSDVKLKKCLGILANSRYVITPAQCVVSNAQRQQFTVVGVKFRGRNNNSLTFGVEEIIPHPFFDAVTGVNDISLLRLNQTVSNEYVATLCKAILWNNASPTGRPLFIYSDLDISTIEQGLNKTMVSTTSLSKEECEEKFLQKGAHVVVTKYDLCTNNLQNATKSTCKEFTGVPLFIENYGMGFIGFSSSRTICDDDLPDIYTNVDAYRGWLLEQMRPWPTKSDPCTTPNGQAGECWHVLYCPALLDAFSNVTMSMEAHLREFICQTGEEGEFYVCCVTSSNSTIIQRQDEAEPANVPTKFLEARLCGLQHRDDYFSSSIAVAIDEFPWLAIIESYGFRQCTGTLINSRYVLTTGHCVAVDMDITIVRLGGYLQFNDTSCVKDPDIDGTDCTETQNYGIEDIIQHPFYIPYFAVNDIGLLRLNKTVSYTDYIRPICLPTLGTLTAKVGDTMYMSSWGSQDDRSKRGIKKKVLTQLIEKAECQRQLRRQTAFNYIKHFNRICTLDYQNNTEFATADDEGGPLMIHNNYRWHVEGLVFELTQNRNLPVVYVNVVRYINWILESMEPW